MRITFANHLAKRMKEDDRLFLLTADLGFGYLDKVRDEFPDRFVNCGVAEQNMVGVACGLAACGKIPFVYSITPFLIDRCFEIIKINVDFDKLNVKLVGGGRGDDYPELGFTHSAETSDELLDAFMFTELFFPFTKKDVKRDIDKMLSIDGPCFISLSRFGCK